MGLRLSDTIRSTRRADPEMVLRRLDRPSATDRAFLDSLTHWCAVGGIDPVIAIAQWLLETDNARSIRWTRDLNPAGIGIVSEGAAQPLPIPDVDASARLLVQCLYALATRMRHPAIPLWPEGDGWFDRVWLPKVQSTAMPNVRTVADLGRRYLDRGEPRATWSWEDGLAPEETYARKLAGRLQELYPEAPDQIVRTVPSATGGPVSMTLEILDRIVGVQPNAPATRLNVGNGRTRPIIHNTSNPTAGADALMHAAFVRSGGGPDRVSFHFACDSVRAVQILPLDRIGFHASDGCDNRDADTGCFDGIAIENCDNIDGDIETTFDNLAELLACIEIGDPRIDYGSKPLSDFAGFIDRTLGHRDVAFDGKWCPEDFLDRYGERGYKTRLKELANAKLALKRGTTPFEPAEPTPTLPDIIPGIDLGIASRLFGSVTGEDGKRYAYDPAGPISRLWTERGKASGVWPKLETVYVYESGARRYFVFADGSVILSSNGVAARWLREAA